MTDRDLAPIDRCEANLWKARYFEARAELVKTNKGLRRLSQKLQRQEKAIKSLWRERCAPYSGASA